jgi:hypothetical protein
MKRLAHLLFLFTFISCTKETYVEGLDLPAQPVTLPTTNDQVVVVGNRKIQNLWTQHYLSIQTNSVVVKASTYSWVLLNKKNTQQFYLKDDVSGKYLAANGTATGLVSQPSDLSTWLIETVSGNNVRIKNLSTAGYLNIETGPVSCGPALSGWLSAQWILAP